MSTETEISNTDNQRSGHYLRRLTIAGISLVWVVFWSLVAAEIYAQREAFQSGLNETSITGAMVTMFLIFILPTLYIIFQQIRGSPATT